MAPIHVEPNTDSIKSERVEARVSKDQKDLFKKAAALQGRSLTDFVLGSVQAEALRTIQEYEVFRLGPKDQEFFVTALLEDSEPGEKLRAAAQRFKDRTGR